ncbi:MAG TPA: hypothetical protein VHB98_16650, partial [Chloroflexota bacterium]|nr:hypothetical protein [Chloroflexota bacterium]
PQRFSLGQLGLLTMTQRFKLASVTTKGGHRLAQIQVSGSQPLKITSGTTLETGTATSTGTLQFDLTSGLLAALHEKIQQHLTVKEKGANAAGGGQTITYTTSLDVVKTS